MDGALETASLSTLIHDGKLIGRHKSYICLLMLSGRRERATTSAMMSSKTALLVSVLRLVLGTACSSPVDEEPSASSEDALTSLPSTGTFAIADRPLSGSYVARLSLSAGKKFEIEYVRRTQSSEPWVWNPWLRVPTTHEETLVLRGTWFTFAGDHGSTQASFDVTDGNGADEHFIFEVASASSVGIELKTIDGATFDLRASSSQGGGTGGGTSIKRVIRCDGMQITAVITLDEAQRRRGTIAIKRKPNADSCIQTESLVF